MAVQYDFQNVLDQLRKHLEDFLLLLSEKERFVVQRRFNLDEKTRATLEEVGQHYQVTRERIRQIEGNALQKLRRNVENTSLHAINEKVLALLKEAGGVLREDFLLSKILKENSGFRASAIVLVVSLDKRFERLPNTIQYHPYICLREITADKIDALMKQSLLLLRKTKDTLSIQQILNLLKENNSESYLNSELLLSLYQIHKSFKLVGDNKVGLLEWSHINPRTLRDKIFYVLRQQGKPMHFMDISNQIIQQKFDGKRINLQAVHNELIRCEDFILIGRGIYALSEWGYSSGTVSDVIASILKEKSPLSQEEIIDEVFKRRQVKPITIILNLKNGKRFTRVGRKQYALK